MAERFERPVKYKDAQDQYSAREVGITHPDNSSFVRIRDNGDIEIMAVDGLGIVLNVARRNMTLVADEIKFLTKEDAGLRWNKFAFNPHADNFSQPALVQIPENSIRADLYKNVQHYVQPPKRLRDELIARLVPYGRRGSCPVSGRRLIAHADELAR